MNIKATKTTRTFIVEERWYLKREELHKIICDHIGISLDADIHIAVDEWSDTEVVRIKTTSQTE